MLTVEPGMSHVYDKLIVLKLKADFCPCESGFVFVTSKI